MQSVNKWLPSILGLTFLLVLGTSSVGYGKEVTHQDTSHQKQKNTEPKPDSSPVESLSPELRGLLSKEMRAIQQGMVEIIPAYASGNWEKIASIAHQIKNSYILKQNLTIEQKHELHTSLPESFVKEDQRFHYLAGMLEHVASNTNAELVGFYFAKMNESCVSCHSQYATHRFPAFVPGNETRKHSH